MLKLGFWDKMKALEQLAKHHGLLAEKIDLNITLEISVRDRDGHALRPTRGLAGALKKTGAGTVEPGRCHGSALVVGGCRVLRRPPQRVDENSDRAPSRADVLDFPTGDPVVDGPATHSGSNNRELR